MPPPCFVIAFLLLSFLVAPDSYAERRRVSGPPTLERVSASVLAAPQPVIGDLVTKGTPIGLLGNSGNSTEPHLHFHLCDRNATIACDGLPYVFDHFSTTEGRKLLELPTNNAVVDFEN